LHDALEVRDRDEMRKRGAFADLSGVFIRADGEPVTGGVTDRMIRIEPAELRAIPDVIGLALPSGEGARAARRHQERPREQSCS
jgi:DNA-binding transcriptional regulator LsrR (DeoR family)